MNFRIFAVGCIVMGEGFLETTRQVSASARKVVIRKAEFVDMIRNRLAALWCSILLVGCCPVQQKSTDNKIAPIVDGDAFRAGLFLDYCWSAKHFVSVDFAKATFIQFVNDDFAMYRLSSGPSEMLYCAYPLNNAELIQKAKELGISYSVYISVLP